MGAMLGTLCNAAFCVIFGLHTTWAFCCMKLMSLLPIAKKTHEDWSLVVLRASWSIAFMLCPWIRLVRDPAGWDEFDALQKKVKAADKEVEAGKGKHKPVFTLGNHTSFLDVPLCVTNLPTFFFYRCRTYMADHLYNLPVLGYICKAVGHFPVHFTSDEEGVFKADQEKQKHVEAKVDAFMSNGGFMSIYPEGQVNKNPDTILTFRYGGMKRMLERDARICILVYHGNPKVWPKKALISGKPGKIVYGGRVIAPDGCNAYVKAIREAGLAEDEKDMEDHALLGKRLQTIMQEMYDNYKAISNGTSNKKAD